MPSQDSIFEQKKKFIERITAELDNSFSDLSKTLLKTIINEFADQLERDGDTIKNTSKNLKLIAQIEDIYNNFSSKYLPEIASFVLGGVNKIAQYNQDYFGTFDTDTRDFQATSQDIKKIIQDRLGVTRGETGAKIQLKKGGYLDSLLQDNSVKNQIKDLSYREVLKNVGFQDFKRGLENFIVGDEERLGGFRQFYRNYAYDIFVQIDRTESSLYAKDIDLSFFIYEGNIIDSSREFCKKRAGKVFSIVEAQKWIDDPWIKSALDKGFISSYDPTHDMGLWSCRHIPRFVSSEIAQGMRPELQSEETVADSVKDILKKAKQSADEVQAIGEKYANKFDGTVTPINFKSEESILRKVNNELGGDISKLKDAVRNTVVVPYSKLNEVVSQLKTDSNFVRIKVQDGQEYMGYKGVLTNIKTENGLIAEMQVNSPGMIYAKEPKNIALNYMDENTYNSIAKRTGLEGGLGHRYYDEIRNINPQTATEAELIRLQELIEASKKYYSNFYGF